VRRFSIRRRPLAERANHLGAYQKADAPAVNVSFGQSLRLPRRPCRSASAHTCADPRVIRDGS